MNNQIPFKNHKGEEFLFVKLPKEVKSIDIDWKFLITDLCTPNQKMMSIPEGMWKLTSPLSEMTEELWKDVVDNVYFQGHIQDHLFENYLDKSRFFFYSLESGESLMQSLGIYLVNPMSHPSDINPTNRNHYDSLTDKWQQAEEQTGNWILLKLV